VKTFTKIENIQLVTIVFFIPFMVSFELAHKLVAFESQEADKKGGENDAKE